MSCFRILCALVAATYCYAFWDQSQLEISVPTLKSDLDYILDNTKIPTRINIKYTDDAVLQLSVVPQLGGQGLCIKIGETLKIRRADGTIMQKSNVVFTNGSLGLPLRRDIEAHIIIKRDKNIKVKPAHVTISYVPIKDLTKILVDEFRDLKKNKFYKDILGLWPDFHIGSSTTKMKFTPEDERFLLSKPLKSISLHKKKCAVFDMLHKKLFPNKTTPSVESVSSGGLPSNRSTKLLGVFFDVWFDPQNRLFGSSNGPLKDCEAVRIYDDDGWHREVQVMILARKAQAWGKRGEHIRKKVLEQDLCIAYKRLYSDEPMCDNVIIEYAEEILLDVRRGPEGDHRAVTATGIRVDDKGGKPIQVRAFYDLENLEYSDEVAARQTIVPETGERSSFFKYIDWEMFLSHMESIWTAMQGRCTKEGKRVYLFSIFYGADIPVQYHCGVKTLAVADTLIVLTDIPKTFVTEDILKAAVSKCKNVSYLPTRKIEAPCLLSNITPIAIQQQPDKFWLRKFKHIRMNAELFRNDIKVLSDILTQKSDGKKLIVGTALLNDNMLFEMKLGLSGHFEIKGNFIQKTASGDVHHNKLLSNNGDLYKPSGAHVALSDVGIAGTYALTVSHSINEFIIASDYLTAEGLKLSLRTVLWEALKRCGFTTNRLSFKLVRHNKFALDGFCDCSKRFVLVEGLFRLLLLKEMNGIAEVHSTRLINDLLYVEDGHLLIAGSGSFQDVFAISLPKFANYKGAREGFGGPVPFSKNSFILFKLKEDSS